MAQLKRLSARKVDSLREPGRYSDGGNLYLNVSKSGARSWIFLYRFAGRQREMGLGSFNNVPLVRARELASVHRQTLASGIDPMTIKAAPKAVTFGAFADEYIAIMKSAWRNEKHQAQWQMTLTNYAKPLRSISIDLVTTEDVLNALKSIWASKPETASRLRGRIEAVLDAAKAKGLRSGENPARWRGHLQSLLPKHNNLSRGHHAAMPFKDVPAFTTKLRAAEGTSVLALEFAILTAARTGEVLGVQWPEIDLDAGVWTIPAERMKAGKEHRVPLSAPTKSLLKRLLETRQNDFVFPGNKRDRPLSNMALEMVLRRMGVEATPHGFRSSFRDWAAEETNFPHEVCEMALAHTIGNKVEAAYRRGDLFDKRRALMSDWADFCAGKT